MAYDRVKIFEQSKSLVETKKLFFIEDIIALLPCAKPTFYDFFPPDSDELNELKAMLEVNRVNLKVSMRSKWSKSQAPALQMALMKLICTDDERKKLSMTYSENDNRNTEIAPVTKEEIDAARAKLENEL